MKLVSMFEAVDGKLFTNDKDCKKHDMDCIGEEFDGLLLEAMKATNGNVTRRDQFKMCLYLLENRNEMLPILKKLVSYIEEVDVKDFED